MIARDNLVIQLESTLKSVLDHIGDDRLPGDLRAWKAFRKRSAFEKELIRELTAYLSDVQLKKIMAALGSPPNIANLTPLFWENGGKEMAGIIQPILVKAALAQAQEILADNPAIGVNWAAINAEAVSWARKYTFDLVKGINETSMDLLRSSVSSYFEQQMTMGQLQDLLVSSFGPVRSELIAVTEITRAASQGEQEISSQIREQGLEVEATWETNDDEFVCDICGPLDGKAADEFDDDGQPKWGEMGPPPAHPRCRCWWTIGFKEAE